MAYRTVSFWHCRAADLTYALPNQIRMFGAPPSSPQGPVFPVAAASRGPSEEQYLYRMVSSPTSRTQAWTVPCVPDPTLNKGPLCFRTEGYCFR